MIIISQARIIRVRLRMCKQVEANTYVYTEGYFGARKFTESAKPQQVQFALGVSCCSTVYPSVHVRLGFVHVTARFYILELGDLLAAVASTLLKMFSK